MQIKVNKERLTMNCKLELTPSELSVMKSSLLRYINAHKRAVKERPFESEWRNKKIKAATKIMKKVDETVC